jgi:predicted SnoaL-like aldol condensation-catalyzing enzyme
MASTEENKTLVLEAFDTLFNKRDYEAALRYWSPNYIQHSAHIEPGREGLFNLIKASPASLKYEPGVIVAEGDFVIVHGRFSGTGLPRNWIAADIVRIADGVWAEHWDVLQDEAARAGLKERSADVRQQLRRSILMATERRRAKAASFTASDAMEKIITAGANRN